jgi:hypothetical protein
MVRWSTKKGTINPNSIISLRCKTCGKEFTRPRWYQNTLDKDNQGRGPFCCRKCGQTGRVLSEESKKKISESQIGISVPSRGVDGHIVPEEVRMSIRLSKTGVSVKADWDIVDTAMKRLGISRYALLRAPIPDSIFIENGKIVALEVEKKPWETDIRKKMKEYQEYHTKWDKVIIMWYDLDGNFRKKWVLENGVWSVVTS